MNEIEIVKQNYDLNAQAEWERLEGFHFEFEITKCYLKKYLKGSTVLDIGGGPGRYSIHLAEQGYDVTLVDLSDGNIALARQKISERSLNIKTHVCDARDLSALNLGQFDNVLLMGPLYHLSDANDRQKCVSQAMAHLKEGGTLFASFISITGGLNYYLDECPEKLINEPALDLFDRMERDESWSGMAFTQATFTNSVEIEPLFNKSGLTKLSLFGQEGITGTRLSYLEKCSEEVRNLYMSLSLRLCENEKYFAYSNHLMYIGKK